MIDPDTTLNEADTVVMDFLIPLKTTFMTFITTQYMVDRLAIVDGLFISLAVAVITFYATVRELNK